MIMDNKINIAELLKDCPSGMELDCTMYDDTFFYEIRDDQIFPIRIKRIDGSIITLTKYGEYFNCPGSKCVIFPKGKTTWEGFHKPFKDGDIVYFITKNNNEYITIFKNDGNIYLETYIDIAVVSNKCSLECSFHIDNIKKQRLATEEEKEKLFDAIKTNGYKWNPETKTLEKLPKFKVGDRIKHIVGREEIATVVSVEKLHYNLDSKVGTSSFSISLQHEWELVPQQI